MAENQISWAESLVVGVAVFGVVGTGTSLALYEFVANDNNKLWGFLDASIVLSAAAASAITGTLAWRVGVRTKDAPRWKGASAGAFVGTAAHPLCWMIVSAFGVASDRRFSNVEDVASFFFIATFISVLVLGWISAPLCALLGALVVDYRSTALRKSLSVDSAQSPPG